MQKRIDLLTQENDILLENFTKLKEKYQTAERIVKTRSSDFQSTYDQMIETQGQLKDLEKNYLELKRIKEILEERYRDKEAEANKL